MATTMRDFSMRMSVDGTSVRIHSSHQRCFCEADRVPRQAALNTRPQQSTAIPYDANTRRHIVSGESDMLNAFWWVNNAGQGKQALFEIHVCRSCFCLPYARPTVGRDKQRCNNSMLKQSLTMPRNTRDTMP